MSDLRFEHLREPAAILRWPAGEPFLSSDIEPDEVMHAARAVSADGDVPAIAFVRSPSGERDHPWITAMGQEAAVGPLVVALLEEYGDSLHDGLVGGATVPSTCREPVSELLAHRQRPIAWAGPDQGAPWVWWWTDAITEPHVDGRSVEWLSADDPAVAERIRDLLAVASPTHWAPPEHPHVRRWAGITADDGTLVACVAETLRIADRPHLASVATHPDHRGQGLAGLVTGWITARLLEEGAPLVSLGMYAHNDVARRVYTRLGYTCAYSWFSSGFASMPASDRC